MTRPVSLLIFCPKCRQSHVPAAARIFRENPSWGYICPVCMWEIDYDVEDDPDAPSDQNNGLSLNEAQMNFRAFGIADPWHLKMK